MPARIVLPTFLHIQNLIRFNQVNDFQFHSLNQNWTIGSETKMVHLHPVALAQLAAWGQDVRAAGGRIRSDASFAQGLPYAIRLGLFEYLGIERPVSIREHESAGRFIPLQKIRNSKDLESFMTDLVPLLKLPDEPSQAVRYCLSELIRNVIEHSGAAAGAVACAQYYRDSNQVAIGVADTGAGVRSTISRNYRVESDLSALATALQPGTSGAIKGVYGSDNAGAGLFFTKSIARLSRKEFAIISGRACYKLRRSNRGPLRADPMADNCTVAENLHNWKGTVVGLNVATTAASQFSDVLKEIRAAFPRKTVGRTDYSKRVRFD